MMDQPMNGQVAHTVVFALKHRKFSELLAV